MQVMRASEQSRTRLRRIADWIGAWYTLLAMAIAIAGWIWSLDANRFLAVLVIATPCPLLIAIPVAMIGGISLAARRGIVVKNPAMLEQIDTCRTIIFDKTGTLTYGRPSLTDVICASGFSVDQVLAAAASLEVYSRHPLAGAILKAAHEAKLPLQAVDLASERPAWIGGRQDRADHRTGKVSATPAGAASIRGRPRVPGVYGWRVRRRLAFSR